MPTIKEIAYLAGVSRGTVDRVLNGRGAVKPETEKKIREIADAVNYTPNRLGKRLAIKKKRLHFGCILFNGNTKGNADNPYFEHLVGEIRRKSVELEEYGITLTLERSRLDAPEELAASMDALLAAGVHGIVLTPVNHPLIIEKINKLKKDGTPVVLIDSDLPDCGRLAYVGSNSYKSGRTAANLMTLFTRGNACIGIVMGSKMVINHLQRVNGFKDYLCENAPSMSVVDLVTNHDDDIESYINTKSMLQRHPEIDSLFLASAGVNGACRAVGELGLAKKITTISFDLVPTTRDLVRQGVIAATIGQQPDVQVEKSFDILLDYLGMGILPHRSCYYTDCVIRIGENI